MEKCALTLTLVGRERERLCHGAKKQPKKTKLQPGAPFGKKKNPGGSRLASNSAVKFVKKKKSPRSKTLHG